MQTTVQPWFVSLKKKRRGDIKRTTSIEEEFLPEKISVKSEYSAWREIILMVSNEFQRIVSKYSSERHFIYKKNYMQKLQKFEAKIHFCAKTKLGQNENGQKCWHKIAWLNMKNRWSNSLTRDWCRRYKCIGNMPPETQGSARDTFKWMQSVICRIVYCAKIRR